MPDDSRQQRRAAARKTREQQEAAAARASVQRQRITILSGVLAVVLVVVAVLVFAGNDSPDTKPAKRQANEQAAGQTAAASLLAGIPQEGRFLGDPKAPITMTEFADVQCPFCKQYTDQALPTVIRDYVKTGKVRLEFRSFPIIDDSSSGDSIQGARLLSAAAAQNKLWNVLEVLYANQGEERTGWLTDDLATSVLKATGVTGVAPDPTTPAVLQAVSDDQRLVSIHALQSTPSFLIGPEGKQTQYEPTALDGAAFSSALDSALKQVAT